MSAEAVRRLVQEDPRHEHAYSTKVKEAVAAYARQRRREGATWATISAEVGVSPTSVRKWMLSGPRPGFHQVLVVDAPEPVTVAQLALSTPSGFVLSGFSLKQAVALLRTLA